MEVSSLVTTLGGELGVEERHILKLSDVLNERLAKQLSEPTDLVLFFPSFECVGQFGKRNGLENGSIKLLWAMVKRLQPALEYEADKTLASLCVPGPKNSGCQSSVPLSSSQISKGYPSVRKSAPTALKKLCADLKRAQNACLKVQRAPQTFDVSESKVIQMKNDKNVAHLQQQCLDTLKSLGTVSNTYVLFFGDGSRVPSSGENQALLKIFFQVKSRVVKYPYVKACRKDFCCFQKHLNAISVPIQKVTPYQVGSFLNDMLPRGPSVPQRVHNSLRWAASVFEINLYTEHDFVKLEGKGPKERAPPKPAKCPSVSLIVQIEEFVADSSKDPIHRIIGGVFLTLTHGVLRWADLQNATDVVKAAHAILGKADMKRQGVRSWVCLLVGISKRDWGTAFWALLQEHNLPADSFFVRKFNSTYSGFLPGPASFTNMLNAVRFFLCHCIGLSVEDACAITLHSPRHLYPTMSRQMLLSGGEQTDIGHWVKNSNMPDGYDAVCSSVEISAKNKIVWAFQNGRKLCAPGEIPVPFDESTVASSFMAQFSSAPTFGLDAEPKPISVDLGKSVPLKSSAQNIEDDEFTGIDQFNFSDINNDWEQFQKEVAALDTPLTPVEDNLLDPPSGSFGPSQSLFISGSVPIPLQDVPENLQSVCRNTLAPQEALPLLSTQLDGSSLPLQVVNAKNNRVHLWHPKVCADWTISSCWGCGSPSDPMSYAEFQTAHDTIDLAPDPERACGSCYRESHLRKLPSLGNIVSRATLSKTSERAEGESTPSDCLSDDSSSSSSSSDSS